MAPDPTDTLKYQSQNEQKSSHSYEWLLFLCNDSGTGVMGVGLPVCLNPAYPHVMALWGSEGAECDCEGNCFTPRDSRNVNTHLMCQSRDAS